MNQPRSVTEQIQQLEEVLRQAMLNSDVDALTNLIADDLIFADPASQLVSKAADIQNYRSGRLKMTALVPAERIIRLLNEAAVVSVLMNVKGNYAGQPFAGQYRYTRVWERKDGAWQIIAGHVSLMR